MALSSGTQLGPYEIVSPLGAGGMGEVYRARDPRLGREVAVKVLPSSASADPERLRRFEQEARAAGAMNHPNILTIYDIGVHEGAPYIVSELLEGETLRERLRSEGAAGASAASGSAAEAKSGSAVKGLSQRRAVQYALQIAHGLAAAHEKGIVHRDLKPENIFITRDGLKILDFGLAKLTQPAESAATLSTLPTTPPATEPGLVLGTVGYMSPEQVRGLAADHRSDIFAFGLILYEMLAGRAAFRRETGAETMTAILKEDAPELSEFHPSVSAAIERVVDYCLEKDPAARFQSARDLGFALEAVSGASGATSAAQAAMPAARKSPAMLAAVAAVLALVLAAGAYVIGKGQSQSFQPPTFSPLTFRRGTITTARFLGDGETILYSAAWDGRPSEIFSSHVGSPEWRSLGLVNSKLLSVSSKGEMAVLVDCYKTGPWRMAGTLARVPVAGGAPRQILENVEFADWAPNGEDMAVAREVEGNYQLEYPIGKVLYKTSGWLSDMRFSPKGDQIAFLDHPLPQDDRGSVAVMDLAGNKKTLTADYASTQGLSWSPDGRAIYFTAADVGNHSPLRSVTLSGKERIVDEAPEPIAVQDVSLDGKFLVISRNMRRGIEGLVPGSTTEKDLSWLDWTNVRDITPDGKTILFDEQGGGAGAKYGVFIRNTDGSPGVRLGDGYGGGLSADGKWALALDFYSKPGHFVLLPTGPGQPRVIPPGPYAIKFGTLLPDGKRIIVNANKPGGAPQLYVQAIDSAEMRPFCSGSTNPKGYAISPDGKTVAILTDDFKLELCPVDGGAARMISGTGAGYEPVGWSEDEKSLFVASRSDFSYKVFRMDIATGRATFWKDFNPADATGVLTIGPVAITPSGKYYAYGFIRALDTLYLMSRNHK